MIKNSSVQMEMEIWNGEALWERHRRRRLSKHNFTRDAGDKETFLRSPISNTESCFSFSSALHSRWRLYGIQAFESESERANPENDRICWPRLITFNYTPKWRQSIDLEALAGISRRLTLYNVSNEPQR